MAEPVNEAARQVALEKYAEADALLAEAEAMPRWRWFARWRRLDKARAIYHGTGLFLQAEKYRDAVERTTGYRP